MEIKEKWEIASNNFLSNFKKNIRCLECVGMHPEDAAMCLCNAPQNPECLDCTIKGACKGCIKYLRENHGRLDIWTIQAYWLLQVHLKTKATRC